MSTNEANLLGRLLEPEPDELTPEAARYFLHLELRPADQLRLRHLAEKARAGSLTSSERTELEEFDRVQQRLSRVKAKAQEVLARIPPDQTSRDVYPVPPADVPPGILRSQQAYWKELPQLLSGKKLRGQWVCYHGDERVGIAPSDEPLLRECLRRQIPSKEYYVACIRPRSLAPWEPEEIEPLGPQHRED